MIFSSLPFLFFYLVACMLVYRLAPLKLRNLVLLVFSLFFYGWGEPVYILIMFASIALERGNVLRTDFRIGKILIRVDFLHRGVKVGDRLRLCPCGRLRRRVGVVLIVVVLIVVGCFGRLAPVPLFRLRAARGRLRCFFAAGGKAQTHTEHKCKKNCQTFFHDATFFAGKK